MDSDLQRSVQTASKLLAAALVVAGLYFCRTILVPLALAGLLAFLLNPLVGVLCRRGLPRAVGVLLVTVVVFSALAVTTWLLGREIHHLAGELPQHRQTIQTRLDSLKTVAEDGVIGRLKGLVEDLSGGQTHPPADSIPDDSEAGPATEVEKADSSNAETSGEETGWLTRVINFLLKTLAETIATAGLVILFVIFMLLRKEDIVQRFLMLSGYGRITVTAKAMDEVGHRVSRYLIAQSAINGNYGLLLAIGLSLIGVPYVLLWGVLAFLLRFVPYVGPWIVAVLPLTLSFAMFDGWAAPLAVMGLIIGLELVTNMILEPIVTGHSVGVSPFSLIVAITFWTWIWGGIGLILATPLTVCLVVFSKYIPGLGWVEILMDEKSSLEPHLHLYQKMLFRDEPGVRVLVQKMRDEKGLIATLDEVVLLALALIRRERILGRLDGADTERLLDGISMTTRRLVEEEASSPHDDPVASSGGLVAIAMKGEAEHCALQILETALSIRFRRIWLASEAGTGEILSGLAAEPPAVLCLGAMSPGAKRLACRLCRLVRERFPSQQILVCLWGWPGASPDPAPLLEAGANWVVTTVRGAVDLLEARSTSTIPGKLPSSSGDMQSSIRSLPAPENPAPAPRAP
ncbi:MAG: AI-2E family transporter [Verrucomicrobiales bacterium]|nr:AI-2E family transporter [Verrucomicrobiales bacterium]